VNPSPTKACSERERPPSSAPQPLRAHLEGRFVVEGLLGESRRAGLHDEALGCRAKERAGGRRAGLGLRIRIVNERHPWEKRIEDLEALVAFQDRSISQLDQVLTRLVAQVERLEADAKSQEVEPPEVGEQCDPPPHY
jgi:uncharacterized coiled-coil protein SlyX